LIEDFFRVMPHICQPYGLWGGLGRAEQGVDILPAADVARKMLHINRLPWFDQAKLKKTHKPIIPIIPLFTEHPDQAPRSSGRRTAGEHG
jgi:hypothetical protein